MSSQVEHGFIGCAGIAVGCIVQPVHRSAVTPWDQMAVGCQGEGGGMMAKLLLNILEGLTRFD
jgi:hypothetical protein